MAEAVQKSDGKIVIQEYLFTTLMKKVPKSFNWQGVLQEEGERRGIFMSLGSSTHAIQRRPLSWETVQFFPTINNERKFIFPS